MSKPHQSKSYRLPDRFVTIPSLLKLKDKGLKYIDVLVYTALKSFNSQFADIKWFKPNKIYEEGCYPSYDTIAKQSGLSKPTVVNAVKRLEAAKLITISRSEKVKVANHYWFPDLDQSYTIPFKLFKADDLTANQKAMLICIRQFYIGEELTCMFTKVIADIAKHLGLSYRTIEAQYDVLVEKGYVIDEEQEYKTNYHRRVLRLSDKLTWIFKALPKIEYSKFKIIFGELSKVQ
ncbi:helix-turn-helix domain-containing protein [Mucilaginibacter sp. KACC 22063]|uniref:helix-turn-helix domain-containing protein n=1 Tax=Mucilaginibacter sp. KACC 22063 TaxID=3025666 RepID=UPI0023652B67|nr:helix-turn-helix domain-containing protein [Mucilaginibacter sp. KACC 22063]WDF54899.1 helix-turn-helix domain-containing protein [Mucilaginibacter sp. KACC 22063]